MGSIVMHLCASNEANKILKCDNNRFLIGSIAPDIHKITTGSRRGSHYIKDVIINNKKYQLPDLDKFLNENIDKMKQDDFYKGYYSHLIADEIWYRELTDRFIDKLSDDQKQIKLVGYDEYIPYEKYSKDVYEDYNSINNFLIQKYNIDVDYLYNVAVLGIKQADLQKLLENTTGKNNTNDIEELKLNILNIYDILEWIKKSKEEIIKRLQEIN
ncbi:MAG: hypothetical protein E7311_00990 [Clostridiales bacterium]|nr:hypothetical protein [Clostridiales bacterium]